MKFLSLFAVILVVACLIQVVPAFRIRRDGESTLDTLGKKLSDEFHKVTSSIDLNQAAKDVKKAFDQIDLTKTGQQIQESLKGIQESFQKKEASP